MNKGYDICACGHQKTGFSTLFCPVCDDKPAISPVEEETLFVGYSYEPILRGDMVGSNHPPKIVWETVQQLKISCASIQKEIIIYQVKINKKHLQRSGPKDNLEGKYYTGRAPASWERLP